MKFPARTGRYQMQAPMTSLIDIVFLLLIYFMLTTNFIVEEGIKIKLPDAAASAPQVSREITIMVDQEGSAFIGAQKIPPDQLFTVIKGMIGKARDRMVIIKADRSVMLNKAVKVMDIAKAAGASKLLLATEKGM
ncbi:MAG: biopolymer transporter ExbD [Desulfobacterales bacterium]|nr:biopolymer transporter ExbD [Desulfobacterales bacterium]